MQFLLTALLAFAASTAARAQNTPEHIKEEAQKCSQALVAGDYEKIVAYTPAKIVDSMGGKAKMVALVKRDTEAAKLKGRGIKDVRVGDPELVRRTGDFLTTLVPTKMVMKVPDGRVEANTWLLGISGDGNNWTFLSVDSISEEQLASLFPEFKGKVQLPSKMKPVFIHD